MSDQLKPCPFCGGKAELWRAHAERTAWIACMSKCSVLVSNEHKTDAEAIAAWNHREIPAAQPSPDVAELVDMTYSLIAMVQHAIGPGRDVFIEPDTGRKLSDARAALARVKGG